MWRAIVGASLFVLFGAVVAMPASAANEDGDGIIEAGSWRVSKFNTREEDCAAWARVETSPYAIRRSTTKGGATCLETLIGDKSSQPLAERY